MKTPERIEAEAKLYYPKSDAISVMCRNVYARGCYDEHNHVIEEIRVAIQDEMEQSEDVLISPEDYHEGDVDAARIENNTFRRVLSILNEVSKS